MYKKGRTIKQHIREMKKNPEFKKAWDDITLEDLLKALAGIEIKSAEEALDEFIRAGAAIGRGEKALKKTGVCFESADALLKKLKVRVVQEPSGFKHNYWGIRDQEGGIRLTWHKKGDAKVLFLKKAEARKHCLPGEKPIRVVVLSTVAPITVLKGGYSSPDAKT